MFTPASQTLLNDLINNVCICCLVVEMVNKGRGWKSKFTPIKINFFNSHNFTNFVFNYMLFDRHLGRGKIVNYTRRRCEKIFSDFKTPFTTFFLLKSFGFEEFELLCENLSLLLFLIITLDL